MPNPKYIINTGGKRYDITQEQFDQVKDKLYEKDPKTTAYKAQEWSVDSPVSDWDQFRVKTSDGRSYDISGSEFSQVRDKLLAKDSGATIEQYSPIKWYNGKAYDTDSAAEAKARLKSFTEANGQFMKEYEQNREEAQKADVMDAGVSLFNPARKQSDKDYETYAPLRQERDKILAEYFENPLIREEIEGKAKTSAELSEKFRGNIANAKNGAERRDWRRAAKMMDDARKMYEAPNKFVEEIDKGNGFAKYMNSYWKGVKDVGSDRDFWTMGLTEMTRNFDLSGIQRTLQKAREDKGSDLTEEDINKFLSPSEKAELQAWAALGQAQSDRAYTLSGAYKAGQGSAESLYFMAQFLLSQGAANVAGKALAGSTNAVASFIGRSLMTDQALARAISQGGKVAEAAAKAAQVTANAGKVGGAAMNTAANVIAKPLIQGLWHTGTQLSTFQTISQHMLDTDKNGDLVSKGRAIWTGLLDSYIENWSESMGGAVEGVLAAPFKGLGWVGDKTLGKTGFGRWARWMWQSKPAEILTSAGFNGLIGEMGEEWVGNAARLATGVMTKDEFKDFASIESQAEMAASFAPMSLFGLGSSALAARRSSKQFQQNAEKVKNILKRYDITDDEIKSLFETRFDTPKDVAAKLAPFLGRIQQQTNDENRSQVQRDYKQVLDFAKEIGQQSILEAMEEEKRQGERDQMRESIEASTGQFWETRETGKKDRKTGDAITTERVRALEFADGHRVFIRGEEDGVYIGVNESTGKPEFLDQQQINEMLEDGTITSDSGPVTLNDYLDQRVKAAKASDEAQRMEDERRRQIADIKARVQEGGTIPIGTVENPREATVVGTAENGVTVQFTNEEGEHVLEFHTWSDVANMLGTPISVKTDAELEAEQRAKYDEADEKVEKYKGIIKGTEMTARLETGEERFKFGAVIAEDGMVFFLGTNENGEEVRYAEEDIENLDEAVNGSQIDLNAAPQEGQRVIYTAADGKQVKGTVYRADDGNGVMLITREDGMITDVPSRYVVKDESEDIPADNAGMQDGKLRDFRGHEIELNEDGSVDEDAFWNRDPEAWARWNDDQRGDDGANSQSYIKAALRKLSQARKKKQESYDNETSHKKRNELEAEIAEMDRRIEALTALSNNYAQRAEAKAREASEAKEADAKRERELREPKSLREVVSNAIASLKPFSISIQDAMRETGLSRKELSRFHPLFSGGKRGRSITQLAELIAADDQSGLIPQMGEADQADINAVRDAIIEVLQTSRSLSDIRNYTRNANLAREQEEREYYEGLEEAAAMAAAEEIPEWVYAGFNSEQEWEDWMWQETMAAESPLSDEEEYERISILADETYNESEDNGQGTQQDVQPGSAGVSQVSGVGGPASEGTVDNAPRQGEGVRDGVRVDESREDEGTIRDEGGEVSGDGVPLDSVQGNGGRPAALAEGAEGEPVARGADAVGETAGDVEAGGPADVPGAPVVDGAAGEAGAGEAQAADAGAESGGEVQENGIDAQGNPIGSDGKFIVSSLGNPDEITDEDFSNPSRNVELPSLPDSTGAKVGANGRKLLIKLSTFLKNRGSHAEITPEESRAILSRVLEEQDFSINDKPKKKPNYWVLVNVNGKYAVVNIDTDAKKTHVEIVGWRWSNEKDIERIKERAIKEGGQVLITNSGAAGLSALQDGSASKDNEISGNTSTSEENSAVQGTLDFEAAEETTPEQEAQRDKQDEAISVVTGQTKEDVKNRREERRKERITKRLAKWKGFIGDVFDVLESIDDIDKIDASDQAKADAKAGVEKESAAGWYDPNTGKAYIYLPNIKDRAHLDRTIVHEVVSHKGLRGLFGSNEKWNAFCDYVWENWMTDESRTAMLEYVNGSAESEASRRAAADEFLAHVAENRQSVIKLFDETWWDRVVEKVKEILNDAMGQDFFETAEDGDIIDTMLQQSLIDYSETRRAEMEARKAAEEASKPKEEKKPRKKASAKSEGKIEDFGEKIGGARKDVARARIRDSVSYTAKDLSELKDPDKILSRKNIAKYVREGQMTPADAATLLAANMAVRGEGPGGYKTAMLVKYRDLAAAWERGEDMVFAVTDADVDIVYNEYGEALKQRLTSLRDRIRESLEKTALKTFNDYKTTYEALNYPAENRDLKSAYIRYGKMDGRYWVVSGPGSYRGWPFATLEAAVTKMKTMYPEVVSADEKVDKVKKTADEKYGHLYVGVDKNGWYRVKSREIQGNFFFSPKFYDKEKAEKYLKENAESLVERELKMIEGLLGSNIGMVEREGVDYRNGRDITEKEFMDTFAPKGVEFGNWVPQVERQAYLNKTYDAIMDFCKIVGISPKAFFLGGKLGIGFGSRGVSRALAHYEPVKVVINLTRMKGAGSLAHEWFHAVDNYLARQRTGNVREFATVTQRTEREELATAFRQLVRAMDMLDYTKRSHNAGAYWGQVEERAARLFENYIYNELGGKGMVSPLLVRKDVLLEDVVEEDKASWPYPSEEENKAMKPYFDNLFATLQEKTDENGNAVLFSKGGENRKQMQLAIINASNPMLDDYHTGIRTVDDIRTWAEAVTEARAAAKEGGWEELASYPDVDNKTIEDALKSGEITVYSSYPIANGVFVGPSKMQAQDYAGEGEVYSKKMLVSDIAWIDTDQGQVAQPEDVRYRYDGSKGRTLLARLGISPEFNVKSSFDGTLAESEGEPVRFSKAYHGTDADFDRFDLSFAGAGEGLQVHGFGHYVALNEKAGRKYAYMLGGTDEENERAINAVSGQIARDEIRLRNAKNDMERRYYEDSIAVSKKRIQALQQSRHLYTVEIPDDTGDNYIDEMKTLNKDGRRRIAAVVRELPEDKLARETHGPNWLPNGFETLANVIEREPYAGFEIRRRLVDALGNGRQAEKETSEILLNAGFVGMKYNGGIDGPCAVIFSNDDIQITEHLRFSKTNQTQNGFISNAEAALDGIQMEKATPEQWVKMLESKGGMKAGEDKWLGLSDWIKSRGKKTITKQEIADYIAENRIQIEEVKYGGSLKDEIKDTIAGGRELSDLQEEIDFQRRLSGDELEGMSQEEIDQWLTNQMVERYGDDFSIGYYIMDGRVDYSIDPYSEREYEENVEGETRPINSIRQGYTTEGLENKAEIALTVPTIEPWNEGDKIHFGDAGEGRAVAWIRFGDATVSRSQDEAEKEYREAGRAYQEYKDELVAKYASRATGTKRTSDLATDEGNTRLKQLMVDMQQKLHDWKYGRHAREKVLVIDEIQSKRHQDARERGYRSSIPAYENPIIFPQNLEVTEDERQYHTTFRGVTYDVGKGVVGSVDEAKAYFERLINHDIALRNDELGSKKQKAVPDAPFEKNWHELAMKRMLRYAAEEGYDYVAWTTGDQQGERYDIGQVVEGISYEEPRKAWLEDSLSRQFVIRKQDGGTIPGRVFIEGEYKGIVQDGTGENSFGGKPLSEVLGKALAERIINAEGQGEISGDGLRIGAEGMKGFYDEILPRFMNKYGKKWGAKVSDMFIPGIGEGNTDGITMHSVPVTQEMKDSVMEGQLMFSKVAHDERRGLSEEEYHKVIDSFMSDPSFDKAAYARARFDLGSAPAWMKKVGITGEYFSLSFKTIKVHENKDEDHALTAAEWHSLPDAIKNPFLITRYKGDDNKYRLYTNILHNGKYVAVGMDVVAVNQGKDAPILEVNRIKTAFGINKGISNSEVVLAYDKEITPEQGALLRGLDYREYPTIQELSESKDSEISDSSKQSEENLLNSEVNIDNEGNIRDISPESAEEPVRYSISKQEDKEYMDAVEAGDMGKARELVNQAALASGYNMKAFHGTNRDFTVFKHKRAANGRIWGHGYYFAEDEQEAKFWGERAERGSGVWGENGRPRMIDAFLSVHNPVEVMSEDGSFVTGLPEDAVEGIMERLDPEYDKEIIDAFESGYLEDFDNSITDRIGEILQEMGYDSVLGSYYGASHIMVFNSNQIKSADPVTYDDNGNVIPLSERFNPDQEDIRFSKRMANSDAVMAVEQAGIAGVVGAENELDFYKDAVSALPAELRRDIIDIASRNGFDIKTAAKEYIASRAAMGFENDNTGELRFFADLMKGYAEDGDLLDDSTARYILWRSGQENGLMTDLASAANKNRWDVGKEEDIRFSKGELPAEIEATRKEVSEVAEDAAIARAESRKSLTKDLLTAAKAMAVQKEYDRQTVTIISSAARQLLKDQNIDKLSRQEVARLLGIVTAANGKSPASVKKYGDLLVDAIIKHLLRSEKKVLDDYMKIKAGKVNATGVEVQGLLDVRGQNVLKALKAGMAMKLAEPTATVEERDGTIEGRLLWLERRMASNDEAVRKEAEDEYAGLSLAKEYLENIRESEREETRLRDDLADAKDAYEDGKMSPREYREFVSATEDSIRENNIERIGAYRELKGRMLEVISESSNAAKEFMEKEKARKEAIRHLANSDMQGRDASPFRQETTGSRIANSSLVRFFTAPLVTFDQMLRLFGEKNISGEGYLWNKYMRQWHDATANAYLGQREAKEELDAKVSEVFGREMQWSDLYQEERRMPKVEVEWWDGGEKKPHLLTQGNLLYIYMVNKMADGRMKLRRMGITEEHVRMIERQMDPRFLELAKWIQEDFLVNKRNKYNAVHERLFGASMAAIEDYFPLKINKRSLNKAEDIGNQYSGESLPATTTGAIIKRKRNAQDLDLLNADAFSVVIEHVDQMEQWAAFAEFNKDINTLLSDKQFRNKVQNMTTVYGSGEQLWNSFKKVCQIAGNSYHPDVKKGSIDNAAVNLAKGVTAAKISFRLYTALKQFLSMPAFIADANVGYLAKNIATPWEAWKWAMENLPVFEKRWKSRIAGDTRLMDNESDWKYFKSRTYEFLSKWGMSPNAFVDAVTVAIGSRSMYQTKYDRYIKEGYSEEEADKRAKQDASILYNETQQSSEGAFVSPIQVERTAIATALSVFRNSSMGYQRQLHDALRNLAKRAKTGYKEESIEFMTKQLMRDGLSEEQAREAAERRYKRAVWRDTARVATFGFVVQFAWNLGSSIAYLLFGDDDEEKQKMLSNAAKHALYSGWYEGLAGGNIVSDFVNRKVVEKQNMYGYSPSLMPIVSDIKSLVTKFDSKPIAAWNDLINLGIQAGLGVNPQTLTDSVVAIVDECEGDLDTSKEAMILIMRILQVPQSQIDQIYIDELGIGAKEAKKLSYDKIAKRYARYKVNREAPITGIFYSDEEREKQEKKKISGQATFKKLVKERKELHNKE